MFKTLEKIKNDYGAEIKEYIATDHYDNPTLIFYELDFSDGMAGIVRADYYMLSVETTLKFSSDCEHETDTIQHIISDLDDLRLEVKNYFEDLRKKT